MILYKLNHTKTTMNRELLMGAMFYDKLSYSEKGVVNLAKKYNHYSDDVFACIVMPKLVPVINDNDERMWCYTKLLTIKEDTVSGFCIMYYNNTEVQIKHIFLTPECRKRGWFTQFITGFKEQFKTIKTISLDTSTEGMIRACNKTDFKLIRKCDNGKDLLFRWDR